MTFRNGFWWLSALVAGMAGAFLAGCEVTSERSTVTLSQSGGGIRKGESISLTARGGDNYVWTLEHDFMGFLNTRQGDTVVYTSRFTPDRGEDSVQIVTVTAGGGSGTNAAISSRTAQAFINHLR